MAKKKWILLAWVFCLLIVTTPGGASAGVLDGLLPKQEEKEEEGSVKLESEKYPLSHYGMDAHQEESKRTDILPWNWGDTKSKAVASYLATANAGLWKVNVILSSLGIAIIDESYSADVVGAFAGKTGELIKDFTGISKTSFDDSGIWGTFLFFILVISISWLGFQALVLRQGSVVASGFLSIFLILGIAMGFFANADKVLLTMNDITAEAKNSLLSYSIGKVNNEEFKDSEGLATIKNQMFNTMIRNPWLLLQFGTADEAAIQKEWDKKGSRVDALLKHDPTSEKRMEAVEYEVEKMKNKTLEPSALMDRLIANFFILVVNFILIVFTVLLVGSMVIYGIQTLIYAMLTIITLLISLIPRFRNTGYNNLGKMIHSFYMTVGLTFLCSINFAFTNWIYSWINPGSGMIVTFIYHIAVIALIFFKRKELLNVISKPFERFNVRNDRGMDFAMYKKAFRTVKTNAVKLMDKRRDKKIETADKPLARNVHNDNEEVKTGNRAATKWVSKENLPKTANAAALGNNQNPAKNAAGTIQNGQGSETKAAQNGKTMNHSNPNQKVIMNISERPKGTEYGPPLHDEDNLRSLEKTLDKGGFAHKVKDGGEIQTAERKVKINDWKEKNHATK